MNIIEQSYGKCPWCESLGAFISVHLVDVADATRDLSLVTVIGCPACEFSLVSQVRQSYKKLEKLGFFGPEREGVITKKK